jgi:excisionase family DNA binding protein
VSERLLTAAEVAERIGFTAGTVLDWFQAGKLTGVKFGAHGRVRFSESYIESWLQAQTVGPGARVAPERRRLGSCTWVGFLLHLPRAPAEERVGRGSFFAGSSMGSTRHLHRTFAELNAAMSPPR